MIQTWRITIKVAAAFLGLSLAAPAVAQEKFPSRPIEMIVPTAPGGGTDIAFRMLAEIATPLVGQKVVVVNKPGASGGLGTTAVVQAKPDGYTIGGLYNAPLTMTPHMNASLHKPSDYSAITLVASAPTILCVKAAFPANDGKEFVEALRKAPNKFTYGNDGVGGITHVSAERVFARLGVKVRPVPFSGAGETVRAFLGDHIDIYGGTIPPIMPYVREKSAKCLLLTVAERSAEVPGAAGLADLGIPNETTFVWRGVIAPKGVPEDRIAVLQKAFAEAAQTGRFKEFLQQRGEQARGTSAAEFRKLIESEYEAMGKVMIAIGLAKK